MELIDQLNEQQRQAVTADLGPVLVLAGPGSGKTRVLTHRIVYLIEYLGVRPYNILAVTFTNKAAKEMHKRIEGMSESSSSGVWLGTFHSTCARILRREANYLPINNNYVIMDSDDQISIIKRIIKEMNIDDKQYRPYSIHSSISNAKNNLVSPDQYPTQTLRDKITQRVYAQYQNTLTINNAVDFDDLLYWTVKLFEQHPMVRDSYARQFQHVLVDEFQDTNLVQYALLKHLSAHYGNLFVVGDEDQSIYRWRGADYRNILRFEEDFPKAQTILLEENYRSTQLILDAAQAVINENDNRTPKDLQSARNKAGRHIILHEAYDDRDEAVYIVDTIRRLTAHGKHEGGEFAIMYRTNAQSRLLEEAFLSAGMDYRLIGAQRFYGRREVKDLIAYLRLIHNPDDEISLGRVINTPRRGIGAKTQQTLFTAAHAANTTGGEVLVDLGTKKQDSPFWDAFTKSTASKLQFFGAFLAQWIDAKDDLSLPELIEKVMEETDYENFLTESSEREEHIDRIANVQELRRLTYEYEETGLEGFLENMALVSDQDTMPEAANAPSLMTLHAAKGLEFPIVFITGLDQEVLPHSRSMFDPEEMAEERRLFYVGITRAEDQLYLTRADRRRGYGGYEDMIPSVFLADIPDELIQQAGRPGTTRHHHTRAQSSAATWEQMSTTTAPTGGRFTQKTTRRFGPPGSKQPAAKPAVAAVYRSGMRVHHALWGDGIVLESKVFDNEETVDIAFEDVGFKKVLASLVKLDILE
ncbi:MAG: UvrD-helicase domain-containing protein [Anaerolineaceae bacterium]|nr:UvrD-helicase domain-containing protein [Anaerolineaceae bacterium]